APLPGNPCSTTAAPCGSPPSSTASTRAAATADPLVWSICSTAPTRWSGSTSDWPSSGPSGSSRTSAHPTSPRRWTGTTSSQYRRLVRFTAQQYGLDKGGGNWGPTRLVYLQHGSDPVVWFNQRLAFERPEWLEADQRAPDVTEEMAWYPIVTMWQVLLDLPAAG